jgi:hypothetical protein
MLQEDQSADSAPRPAPRRCSCWTAPLLVLVVLVVLVLRHDFWNWQQARPLLFGFLPIGLWWQGLVSLLAAAMMWLMVRLAWPQHLEDQALQAQRQGSDPNP